jgi:aspartyl-tRNA(Asn)/glutamyl-tRNA(Gln) amidotransferase subunit B
MIYQPVIGLEVHVELKTASKMFCSCSADYFGKEPNSHTCPTCLGLPGALPVPNKKAIEWCVMIGLALNCDIPLFTKFDRKNYFYPDLAKGYQISQYDEPFCLNGYMELANGKRIGIRRVHMEEDTGKLFHEGEKSLIDFNRSGVPLVEIVTEPDFDNAQDVKIYVQKLQQIVRYLNVADADMEKGQMRLEPNISLREITDQKPENKNKLPKYKVEVKNINSFRFVEKAIAYEIKRQQEELEQDITPLQETRGWDENHQKTISQRMKEESNDYRYFPEPDIPPIQWLDSHIFHLKSEMPELPDTKMQRFVDLYQLSRYDAEILTRERPLADYFEEAVRVGTPAGVSAKQIANTIINKKVSIDTILPATLITDIRKATQTLVIGEEKLKTIINEVLAENEKAVVDYKSGKETVIMFLVGQVMRKAGAKIDAQLVKEKLQEKLS